jgi:hypothetical protein
MILPHPYVTQSSGNFTFIESLTVTSYTTLTSVYIFWVCMYIVVIELSLHIVVTVDFVAFYLNLLKCVY